MPVFVLSHRDPIVLLLPLLYHNTSIIALSYAYNLSARDSIPRQEPFGTLFSCFGRCIVET